MLDAYGAGDVFIGRLPPPLRHFVVGRIDMTAPPRRQWNSQHATTQPSTSYNYEKPFARTADRVRRRCRATLSSGLSRWTEETM